MLSVAINRLTEKTLLLEARLAIDVERALVCWKDVQPQSVCAMRDEHMRLERGQGALTQSTARRGNDKALELHTSMR